MKLIREYASQYVHTYVVSLCPTYLCAGQLDWLRRLRASLDLTRDLTTVSKQGIEFIFAKYRVGIAESRKIKVNDRKSAENRSSFYLSLSLTHSLTLYIYLYIYIYISIYTSLSISLSLSVLISISRSLSLLVSRDRTLA